MKDHTVWTDLSHTFKDLIEQWMLLSFVFLSSSDHRTEERDIMVKQADLKNYLTLTEVDRKPRWVYQKSGWNPTILKLKMYSHRTALSQITEKPGLTGRCSVKCLTKCFPTCWYLWKHKNLRHLCHIYSGLLIRFRLILCITGKAGHSWTVCPDLCFYSWRGLILFIRGMFDFIRLFLVSV